MAGTWPVKTWVDGEIPSKANLNEVGNKLTDLDQHSHTGADGDGSADINPDTVTFDSISEPSTPAAGKLVAWNDGETLKVKDSSGTATVISLATHTHTLSNQTENHHIQDDDDQSSATTWEAFLRDSDSGHNPTTYGAISAKGVTFTPSKAGNSTIIAGSIGGAGQDSGGNAVASNTPYLKMSVGGSQKLETSRSYSTSTAFNKISGGHNDVWVEEDDTASSKEYKVEFKVGRSGGDASWSHWSAMSVVEVGF